MTPDKVEAALGVLFDRAEGRLGIVGPSNAEALSVLTEALAESRRDAGIADTYVTVLVAFAEVLSIPGEASANPKTFISALIEMRKNADRYAHVRRNPAMLLHLRNSEFDSAVDAAMKETP